jgi:hypothetical protein
VAAMLDVSAFIAPFVWSGLLPLWPAPGQGPPDGVQKQGGFRAVVLASRVGDSRSATHGADAAGRPDAAHAAHARLGAAAGRDGGGSVARVDIHGRGDMGYALTSKLLAEVCPPLHPFASLCLHPLVLHLTVYADRRASKRLMDDVTFNVVSNVLYTVVCRWGCAWPRRRASTKAWEEAF